MLFHTPPVSDPASPVTADGGVEDVEEGENRMPKGGPEKAGEPASVNTPLSSIVHRWMSLRELVMLVLTALKRVQERLSMDEGLGFDLRRR